MVGRFPGYYAVASQGHPGKFLPFCLVLASSPRGFELYMLYRKKRGWVWYWG